MATRFGNILTVANTTALSTKRKEDARTVLVEGNGLYEWAATASGTNFAATGGGFWVRKMMDGSAVTPGSPNLAAADQVVAAGVYRNVAVSGAASGLGITATDTSKETSIDVIPNSVILASVISGVTTELKVDGVANEVKITGLLKSVGKEVEVATKNRAKVYLSGDGASPFRIAELTHYWDGSAFSTTNGIAIGRDALLNNSTIGTIAIGDEALMNNIGGGAIGIGYQSGKNNTGSSSTIIGYYAGTDNVGGGSTLIGYNAGNGNTGFALTSIGSGAGSTNTGANSVFVGENTGTANTGTFAVGIGNSALGNNIGNNAVAVGQAAGMYNRAANFTAIGTNALENNVGTHIVGLGSTILKYNNWNNRILIGHLAGNQFIDDAATIKSFTDASITGFQDITITAHNFGAVGGYVNLKYNLTSGTHPIGWSDGMIRQYYIVDANTLRIIQGSIPAMSAGTFTFTKDISLEGTIEIGYNALATKANQTILGGTNTTETVIRGNILIGTTTATNHKLQVVGGVRFSSMAAPAGVTYMLTVDEDGSVSSAAIAGGGGGGEVNTGTSLGAGTAIYAGKDGVALQFNSMSTSDFALAGNIFSLNATLKSNWNAAFSWGDHSGLYATLADISVADNRVVIGTGTGLEGDANLTWSGTEFTVINNVTAFNKAKLQSNGIHISRSSDGNYTSSITTNHSGTMTLADRNFINFTVNSTNWMSLSETGALTFGGPTITMPTGNSGILLGNGIRIGQFTAGGTINGLGNAFTDGVLNLYSTGANGYISFRPSGAATQSATLNSTEFVMTGQVRATKFKATAVGTSAAVYPVEILNSAGTSPLFRVAESGLIDTVGTFYQTNALANNYMGVLSSSNANAQLVMGIDANLGPVINMKYGNGGYGNFTASLNNTLQFAFGMDNLAAYGGTVNNATGRSAYIYDYPSGGAYRWGIAADGTMYVGPSSTTFGMKVTQAGATTITSLVGTGTRVVLASAAGLMSAIANGTDGHVLKLVGGTPTWSAESGGGGVTDGDKGEITVTGGVWAIDNGVVTLAKMADVATGTVFYRKTAATGAPEVQTLATLKTDLGLTGTNSGDQTITLTGDVSGSGTGSFAATIGNNVVTLAKMATMATASFLGRNTAAVGNVEVLSTSTVRTMLSISNVENTALSTWVGSANITTLGTIATGTWNATTIGVNKGGTGATTLTGVVIGDGTNAMTAVAGTANQLLRRNAGNTAYEFFTPTYITGNQSITLSGDVGGTGTTAISTTIGNNVVTLAKMATMATASFLGRNTAAVGNVEVLSVATVRTMLSISNVENTALSTWAGTSNITTLGTIGTGTWNGTTIGVANGGTGATTLTGVLVGSGTSAITAIAGTANQLLRRNSGNTAYEFFTPTYITGNQSITLSGDVGGTGTTAITATIGANVVTNAKLAQVATGVIKGRVTSATGNLEDLSGTQVTTLLDTFTSALKGLVPASGGGTTNFLRADGTWAAPPGGGGGALDDLSDVVITTATNGQVLQYNGTNWVNTNNAGTVSATQGYVIFGTGASTGTSAQFFWDQPNSRLVIGSTTSETAKLTIHSGDYDKIVLRDPGTAGFTQIRLKGSGAGDGLFGHAQATSAGTGALAANNVYVYSSTATGLVLCAQNATGTISFYTGGSGTGNLRGSFSAAGVFNVANLAGTGSRVMLAASTGNLTALANGTDGHVLTLVAGAPVWQASSGGGMSNPMTTTGDIIYSSSGSTPARLGAGTNGHVLTLAGGVPTWAAPTGGGGLANNWTQTGNAGDLLWEQSTVDIMQLTTAGILRTKDDVVPFYAFSDARLKHDVIEMDGEKSLATVKNLRPVFYRWNDGSRKDQQEIGFIAQDVEKHLPQVVSEKGRFGSIEEFKSVDYEKMTALLVSAMQIQDKRIQELTQEIEELKNNTRWQ